MKKLIVTSTALVYLLIFGMVQACAGAARDYISIVGSSTVYPFATVVAENFGKKIASEPRRLNPQDQAADISFLVPVLVWSPRILPILLLGLQKVSWKKTLEMV